MDAIAKMFSGLKLISEAEAAQCTFLVCSETSYFGDDVSDRCSACFIVVYHRPFSRTRGRKICLNCAAKQMAKEEQCAIQKGEKLSAAEIGMTIRTVSELASVLKKSPPAF